MTATTPTNRGVGAFARHAAHLVRQGYQVIPIPLGSKGPELKDWRNRWPQTPADAEAMAARHRTDGLGILTNHTPAVDIDVLDAGLVAQMSEFVRDNCGEGLLRIGKAPKALFLFATDTPFAKITSASYIDPANPTRADGKPLKQRIEVLGEGQQFVAFHIHPETGKPYVWPEPGEDPLEVSVLDLPTITAAHARAVCSFFEKIAERAGWKRATDGNDGDGQVVDLLAQAAPPSESEAEVERVRNALKHVSPDCSREDYLAVLAGLKWTGWLQAEELALEWASGSEEGKFNEHDFNRDWKSLKGERLNGRTITLGSVIKLAQDGGFDASRAAINDEVAAATYDSLLAKIDDLEANNTREYRRALITELAEAKLTKIDKNELERALAKAMKCSMRDVKSFVADAKRQSRQHSEPTHAAYAKSLLALIEERTGQAPIGCEGKIWTFEGGEGLWIGRTPQEFEVTVANEFDGLEGCSRRTDYLAVANHAYSICSAGRESWFEDGPIGMACLDRFYTLSDGAIKREQLAAHHRQRHAIDIAPRVMPTPLWDKLMADAFAGDGGDDQRVLLEDFVGAAMIGAVASFEKALLMMGVGRAGKGTILKVIGAIFPRQLSSSVSPEKWDHEYYRAELAGKRINLVGELGDEKPIDAASFKNVLGRDEMTARPPSHRPFSFRNTAGHIFNSNHFVATRETTDAFFARWLLIEFRNSLVGREGDIRIDLADAIIKDELPGVMAKFLAGAKRLFERGHFVTGAAHDRLMAKWRNRTNSVIEFIRDDDVCVLGTFPHVELRRGVFYQAYVAWCKDSGRKAIGKQKFYDEVQQDAIKRLGVRFVAKAGDSLLVRGIALRNQVFGSVEDDEL